MRLIDADPLYADIQKHFEDLKEQRENAEDEDLRGMLCGEIIENRKLGRKLRNAPTIDAVPVIRCLTCAWRSAAGFCGRHGHPVSDDFFCAHGTTEIIRKPGPAKKTEKKAEEICLATGRACSKCTPGPCDHRRTVIPDGSGQ